MLKFIFRSGLRLAGWKLKNKSIPETERAILIFAPHTSNWDFVVMVAAKFAWGFKVRYLGKHSLFKFPFGWFFKALGGIPVVRHKSHNVVDQVVELIQREEKILLALAPEGTRSYTAYWKSGFYHIAEKSKLPIIMFYLDNKTRTIGCSKPLDVTGNINEDMEKIKNFYSDKEAYYPELTSLVQTKQKFQLSKKANAKDNN